MTNESDDDTRIMKVFESQSPDWSWERQRERKFLAYRDAALMACGALRAIGARADVIEAIESRLPLFGEE